jgi:hypothetical protein
MNDQKPRYQTDAATSAKAPLKPTKDGVAPIAVRVDTDTRFAGSDGDYFVAVSAVNKSGESPLEFMATTLTSILATQVFDIKFAATAGTYSPTGYKIYISKKDETLAYTLAPMYPVAAISVAELAAGYDGAAAGLVALKNRIMPNTRKAMLIENTLDVYSFKQLAPIMKMDLARISTADRFMVLLFGTPQLYAPKKMVVFVNVGAYVAP